PMLKVRRGIYFSEDEVRAVINELAFNSQFTWFNAVSRLYYPTRQSAVDALYKAYPEKQLTISDNLYLEKTNQTTNTSNTKDKKEMFLVAFEQTNCSTKNTMDVVKLNLFTGETSISSDVCSVSN
ncbi:MAG: hypothetical protein ACR2IQ_01810, partial [Minisyncoccia bacterium]